MAWIGDVGGVVIKGRQRPDHTDHDRHGMGAMIKTTEKTLQTLIEHAVMEDDVAEIVKLFVAR